MCCSAHTTPLYDSPPPFTKDLPLIAFSFRPADCTGGDGVSRFSRMEFLCMHGVSDSAGPVQCSRIAHRLFWPSDRLTTSASRNASFEARYPAYKYPCPTLQVQPRGCPHMARGQSGSLLLLCTTLSFATPCRFIPALSRWNGLRHLLLLLSLRKNVEAKSDELIHRNECRIDERHEHLCEPANEQYVGIGCVLWI
jgi:hypothetical protein